jgi:hypothetical protein
LLNTGDTTQDYPITCGNSYEFAWASNSKTADTVENDAKDFFNYKS